MTKDEIKQWIKTSTHVTTDYCEFDSNSNHYARDIFEKDGELWAVEYINGDIIPAIRLLPEGDLIKEAIYRPRKVICITRNIPFYEYVEENSSNDYGIDI